MKKIFVIDDDEAFQRMIGRSFTAEGFEVVAALEGADALAQLYMMDSVPSAILLDIMIPVLSGIEILIKIKQSDKLKNIPVIILSNLSPSEQKTRDILALGALMYLHKTQMTSAELIQKVNSVIKT